MNCFSRKSFRREVLRIFDRKCLLLVLIHTDKVVCEGGLDRLAAENDL